MPITTDLNITRATSYLGGFCLSDSEAEGLGGGGSGYGHGESDREPMVLP